jgi:hypothetical protein
MHPYPLERYAAVRMDDALEQAQRLRQHRLARRARPPSRGRRWLAALLVRAAARLADEPSPAVARRA